MNEHFFFVLFSLIAWIMMLCGLCAVVGVAFMLARGLKGKLIYDMGMRINMASIIWTGAFVIAWAFDHKPGWVYFNAVEFVFFIVMRIWLVHLGTRADWETAGE